MKPESSCQGTVSGHSHLNARTARILMASLFTGLLIGVVGGLFELSLIAADRLRNAAVIWARAWPSVGWLVPLGIGVIGAALARLLVVRFAPEAEGGGVQRVEAD